tara:strand:- start:3020 stop:3619 length:600 start_codon:yes stop_codon:yes gene_type:complete
MDKFLQIERIKPTLDNIIKVINHVTGITIQKKTRKQDVVRARKIYYKISFLTTDESLTTIANAVGLANHGTVLFHLNDVDELLKIKKYRDIYDKSLKLISEKTPKLQLINKKDKIVYFVEKVVEVKKEVIITEKLVDVYNTGIPEYIINHLKEYSKEELLELFNLRLLPYKKFLDIKKTNEELIKPKNKRIRKNHILYS